MWLLLASPLLWVLHAYRVGDLFYGEVVSLTGKIAVWFLILSVAATPLRQLFRRAAWPNWVLRQRRYFGVAAFGYAAVHTVVYLDRKGSFELVVAEASEFSMWSGWIAMLIFTALAATSNNVSVRRLGRRWKKLHRFVYVAAILTFMHWIFAAFNFVPGLLHFLLVLSLEACRLWTRPVANTADPGKLKDS